CHQNAPNRPQFPSKDSRHGFGAAKKPSCRGDLLPWSRRDRLRSALAQAPRRTGELARAGRQRKPQRKGLQNDTQSMNDELADPKSVSGALGSIRISDFFRHSSFATISTL